MFRGGGGEVKTEKSEIKKAQEKLDFDRMKSKIYKNEIFRLMASQDLYLGQF